MQLLDIPLEIRRQIWKTCFNAAPLRVKQITIQPQQPDQSSTDVPENVKNQSSRGRILTGWPLNLLLLCKQTYAEIHNEYLIWATFYFELRQHLVPDRQSSEMQRMVAGHIPDFLIAPMTSIICHLEDPDDGFILVFWHFRSLIERKEEYMAGSKPVPVLLPPTSDLWKICPQTPDYCKPIPPLRHVELIDPTAFIEALDDEEPGLWGAAMYEHDQNLRQLNGIDTDIITDPRIRTDMLIALGSAIFTSLDIGALVTLRSHREGHEHKAIEFRMKNSGRQGYVVVRGIHDKYRKLTEKMVRQAFELEGGEQWLFSFE